MNKKTLEESGQIVVESIDNIRTVAGLGLEDKFYNQYISQLDGPLRYYSANGNSCSCICQYNSHAFAFYSRSNIKHVCFQGLAFSIALSITYYIYAAGYWVGAFLIVEGRTEYEDVFRYV